MHNLLSFLSKFHYIFLFVVLEVFSLFLLFNFNGFQGSVYFTSANYVTGQVYDYYSRVLAYFSLGSINKELTEKNVRLQAEVNQLSQALYEKTHDRTIRSVTTKAALASVKVMIPAEVVSNSLDKKDNYIVINKGSADGVRQKMGVTGGNGIVGYVYMTTEHYSLVLPVLNSRSSISCRILGRQYFGYLHWEGGDVRTAYVDDIPRHAHFKLGDFIVTSGYSDMFPEGLLVGQVRHVFNSRDGLSYRLQVQLSTDFSRLRDVYVVSKPNISELKFLTDSIQHAQKLGDEEQQ